MGKDYRTAPISRQEWRRVLLYALLLVGLTTAPYGLAWATQGEEWWFNGALFGTEDMNAYLGKMRLGARGLWDFHLFYSPEPHDGVSLLYLPYIAPGQVVGQLVAEDDPALSGVLVVVFHALRVIFSVALIPVMYRFIAVFLTGPATRFLALIFATLGGGLGWLLVLLGQTKWLGNLPPEFYIPEGFSFLVLLGLPHIALARIALLLGFIAFFNALRLDRWQQWARWAILAGLVWILVGLAVTFYFVVIYCILGAWGLATWLRAHRFPVAIARRGAVAAGVTFPLFLYYLIAFNRNDAFRQWSAQNLLPSPHPLQYGLAYLILGLWAAAGARWAWRRSAWRDPRPLLLIGWVAVVPVLVYLPINVQRRLAEGVLIPLAILAAAGVRLAAGRMRPPPSWLLLMAIGRGKSRQPARFRESEGKNLQGALALSPTEGHTKRENLWRRWRLATIIVTSLSSAFLLLGSFLTALNHDLPVFRPADELAALDWLNGQAPAETVVMGSMDTGNFLPVRTNLRPYLGHGPETLYSDDKKREVKRFYRDELSEQERQELYRSLRIRYIFYGPTERELAQTGDESPEWAKSLRLVYDRAGYQIFQVEEQP